MLRRLHVTAVRAGPVELDREQAHHARDVLRLRPGERVEVFDDAGAVGQARIEACDERSVVVLVDQVDAPAAAGGITIAAAVPKGDRADWMIEKLSELGVERFIPLSTARSIVHPGGSNKLQRWRRIATESSKQSRRAGVMRIDPLTDLSALLAASSATPRDDGGERLACYLDTDSSAAPLIAHAASWASNAAGSIILLIGPEGGWTADETAQMRGGGLTAVKLTATILRVETAAVVAAAIVASWRAAR